MPQLPLQFPHEYTLGDIILGTRKITEDCESDGIELDNYLPVSFLCLLYFNIWEVETSAFPPCLPTLLDGCRKLCHLRLKQFPMLFSFLSPQVIITHGLCHLLGYTHETQEDLDKVIVKLVLFVDGHSNTVHTKMIFTSQQNVFIVYITGKTNHNISLFFFFWQMRNKEIHVLEEFNKRTGYNAIPITPDKVELFRSVMNKTAKPFLRDSYVKEPMSQVFNV